MSKLSVRELDVKDKRVFVRVDFNVPLTDTGRVSADVRIRAALPTIELLLKKGATVLLGSHLGKPEDADPKLSLKPVAEHLGRILDRGIQFAPDCIGPKTKEIVTKAPKGAVILLENLRFHPGEKTNDPEFCKELASLGDRYVNDAFGTAHRAHASTTGVAALFDRPAAGLLMEKEIEFLGRVVQAPARPFVAIIGGSKISDKAGVIANLLPKVDRMLIGGGAVFNFFKALGREIGKSVYEPELAKQARELAGDPRIVLPADMVAAPDPNSESEAHPVPIDAIPADEMGLDIGPATAKLYAGALAGARTVVWAGPMGVFEKKAFAHGTESVARAVAALTETGATTVVGGGDTVAALTRFGLLDKVSHASTGGTACLEFLEGKELPGIAALADAE